MPVFPLKMFFIRGVGVVMYKLTNSMLLSVMAILISMTVIVLYNFRYKKLSKPCTQLLRYKQPVPYLPVNASVDNPLL